MLPDQSTAGITALTDGGVEQVGFDSNDWFLGKKLGRPRPKSTREKAEKYGVLWEDGI